MLETYVLLIRGINVGGKNVLKMNALKDLLSELGYSNIRTYIQSGNVVFSTEKSKNSELENQVSLAIQREFNIEAKALVLTGEEFRQAIDNNPFSDPDIDPKRVHMAFLAEVPAVHAYSQLDELRAESEDIVPGGKVLYLHAPKGIGRSKLISNLEKTLGVSATMRNLRTVSKISALLSGL